MNTKTLKVQAGSHGDDGSGTVRIDSRTRQALGIKLGDIVEITKGNKVTGGIVRRLSTNDKRKGIIQMDCWVRANLLASKGDKVEIRKIDSPQASKVTLIPAPPITRPSDLHWLSRFKIRTRFMNRPLRTGIIIYLGETKDDERSMAFSVKETVPEGTVTMGGKTKVIIKE